MLQVEAVRFAVAQRTDPKARGLRRRLADQTAQHRADQAEPLELFGQVEVLDAHRLTIAFSIGLGDRAEFECRCHGMTV